MLKLVVSNDQSRRRIDHDKYALLFLSIGRRFIRNAEGVLMSNGFEVNYTQFRLMRALAGVESFSTRELASIMEHDAGAMSRLLDRLVEKGYVERRRNSADRRATEVSLTGAGRAAWEAMQGCRSRFNKELLEVLDDKERSQLSSLLYRVLDHLDQQDRCAIFV